VLENPQNSAQATEPNRFALNPAVVIRTLGMIAIILVTAHIAGQLVCAYTGHYPRSGGVISLFNLDVESNIPSSFAMILLLTAALLLSIITSLERRRRAPGVGHWVTLSAGFLVMAIDEACSLHEKLIRPIHALFGGRELGIFYFSWVIPAFGLLAGLGWYFVGFLRRLPPSTRRAFFVTGLLYLGGAVGVELIAGRHVEVHGYNNLPYAFLVVAEEGLEMTGVILFLKALLAYLREHYGEVNFHLGTVAGR
jgi:hypothetical protein